MQLGKAVPKMQEMHSKPSCAALLLCYNFFNAFTKRL